MKIIQEIGIRDFKAWSGAIDTQNRIIECDKCNEFDSLIEDLYPEGLTNTQLNDILWFEDEWIFESIGIAEDDEDEDEEE